MPFLKVNRVLKDLGERIRVARKKRRFRVKDFAERIGVAEGTAIRLEKGDPGIRMETFAMALMALGLLDRLERLLDPAPTFVSNSRSGVWITAAVPGRSAPISTLKTFWLNSFGSRYRGRYRAVSH